MASRFVVCTHGVGDCHRMLQISSKRTVEWCKRFRLDFRASTRRLCADSIFWDKALFVRSVMSDLAYGDVVIWIDADCIICNTDEDPRKVLGDCDYAALWITPDDSPCVTLSYYQSGVQFIRVTPQTRELFDAICDHIGDPTIRKEGSCAWDEDALNRELKNLGIKVQNLEPRWNCTKEHQAAIIRGYHGWDHNRVQEKLKDELCCSIRKIRKEA